MRGHVLCCAGVGWVVSCASLGMLMEPVLTRGKMDFEESSPK